MKSSTVRVTFERDPLYQLQRSLERSIEFLTQELLCFNHTVDALHAYQNFCVAQGNLIAMRQLNQLDYTVMEVVVKLCQSAVSHLYGENILEADEVLRQPLKWSAHILADLPIPFVVNEQKADDIPDLDLCPTPDICSFVECNGACKGGEQS